MKETNFWRNYHPIIQSIMGFKAGTDETNEEPDEEALDEILLKNILKARGKKWIINQLK